MYVVVNDSCGLEMEAMSVSLGSKELGINLFVMKKQGKKTLEAEDYFIQCLFTYMFIFKDAVTQLFTEKLRQLWNSWLWLKPLDMVLQ